jgi:hypothetical protein
LLKLGYKDINQAILADWKEQGLPVELWKLRINLVKLKAEVGDSYFGFFITGMCRGNRA